MNDAPTDPAQRDYRDTVFVPQTSTSALASADLAPNLVSGPT
jgi:hypothetical protein